jgi:uncharacterized protein (TIGR00369 family)
MRKLNPEYLEAARALVNRSPYFTLLSMSLHDVGIGYSLFEIDLQNKHFQPFGAVHGGVFASIIDAAAFWSVFCEVDENAGMTSVDLKINYLAPSQGGKLIARGRRIKVGKTLALAQAEVINQNSQLLAHGTSTLMILPNLEAAFLLSLPRKFIINE